MRDAEAGAAVIDFPHLFQPGRIGNLEVKNRIIASPMERNYCAAEGRVTQRYIDYMAVCAHGGVGLQYTEATYVDPRGRGRLLQMGLYKDDLIPEFARLVAAVHREGGAIGPELHYGGSVVHPGGQGIRVARALGGALSRRRRVRAARAGSRRNSRDRRALRRRRPPCCRGRRGFHRYPRRARPPALAVPLALVQQARRRMRRRPRRAHAVSARGPRRRAQGNRGHRADRLPHQRRRAPGQRPGLADVCAIAPHLVAAGVNLVDVAAGMYETNWWIAQPMEMPQGVLAPLAREVRRHVDVPVSVSGRISDPSVAEQLIEWGACDFVTMGRALHADPEFPAKARAGHTAEICTCIACNQGCSDMHSLGLPIVCLVNTTTGREREYSIRPTPAAKRIVVVGGGPAGLEAARILALRGHSVTLFERNDEPGGQMLLSRLVPGREESTGHLTWLVGSAERAGVRLLLGVEADANRVLAERPDIVIVATGSELGLPNIHGILDSPVVDAYEILRRPLAGIGRALVIGGDIRGLGVARVLAEKNVAVILVEPSRELVSDIGTRSRRFQVGALEERPNVMIHLGTTVEALGERSAQLWNGTERWDMADIDIVVPTRMLLPVSAVADALHERTPSLDVYVVGDCAQPCTALEAIHDAAALAHRL